MTHSPEIQTRLNQAIEHIDTYQYEGDALDDKVLVAFIAPSGVGKSTLNQSILEAAAAQELDAGEVATWTTRPGRTDDPAEYRTDIPMETMLDLIEAKQLVNWAPHPSGAIYGTGPESYPATYNFLPMLPDALPMLRRAGFKAIYAYYLTASVDAWQHHLDERRDHQFTSRLLEGRHSLAWAQEHQHELTILHNHEGKEKLDQLANRILSGIRGVQIVESDEQASEHLQAMQSYISARLAQENTDDR